MLLSLLLSSALAAPLSDVGALEGITNEMAAGHADLVAIKLSGNDEIDAELLTVVAPAKLKALQKIVETSENAPCGAVVVADAILHFAALGLSIEAPKELTEEESWAYMDILEERVFPQYYDLEQLGIDKLEEVLEAGMCTEVARARLDAYSWARTNYFHLSLDDGIHLRADRPVGVGWVLRVFRGWGDCPSGCMSGSTAHLQVNGAGKLKVRRIERDPEEDCPAWAI